MLRDSLLCRVHVAAPWPFPWCPPHARMVSPPCRGVACHQSLPGPGLAARKQLLPTPTPASPERGQRSQTGGRRWQGPEGPGRSLQKGHEAGGGKQHVIPACGSRGKGESRAKGSRGPGSSAVGEGQGLWPPIPAGGSHPGPQAPAGPCPHPISGEKVRLLALPSPSNESHIHSVLLAFWKTSLHLLGLL